MLNKQNISKPTIYGIGLVALDIVISSVPDSPKHHWAGGTCGNVLTILSYLGWDSKPIARLDSTKTSVYAKNDMKSWGVDCSFLEMAPTANIPVVTQEIFTNKNGIAKHKFHMKKCPRCGSWLPNYKPVTLKATAIIKASVQSSDVFFFDRTSPGALDLARYFKTIGAIVVFEPSAKGTPKQFKEALELADIVKYSNQRFDETIFENIEIRPKLEIQTLGEHGIRYRIDKASDWSLMSAFKAGTVKDTCGCGDWMTAGLIMSLCEFGRDFLYSKPIEEVVAALEYGQAMGAWNCSFEGARSGMYRFDKNEFDNAIDQILTHGSYTSPSEEKSLSPEHASDGLCPKCPQYPLK